MINNLLYKNHCIIAFPLSYWAMHTWLQSFAYRIKDKSSNGKPGKEFKNGVKGGKKNIGLNLTIEQYL